MMMMIQRNFTPNQSWPGLPTTAKGAMVQQGAYEKCATVGHNVKMRVATVNVGVLVGRSREVVEMLARRRVDVCCVDLPQGGRSEKVCQVVSSYEPQGGRSEEEKVCQVVSSYAPQGGRLEEEKICHVVSSYATQEGRSEEEKICHVVSSYATQEGRSEEEKVCHIQDFYDDVQLRLWYVPGVFL